MPLGPPSPQPQAVVPVKQQPPQPQQPRRRQYQDLNHVRWTACLIPELPWLIHTIAQLLGFTLPPRAPPPPPSPRRSTKRAPGHSGHFDKGQYVNSTFRFVMKPTSGSPASKNPPCCDRR